MKSFLNQPERVDCYERCQVVQIGRLAFQFSRLKV